MFPSDYVSVRIGSPYKLNISELKTLQTNTTCLTVTRDAPIHTFMLAKDLGFNRVLVNDYLIHLDLPVTNCYEKVFVRKW